MAEIRYLTFTDIETTGKKGPNTREDPIIEIAAARVDLQTRAVVDSFETLIKPPSIQGTYPFTPAQVIDFGTASWDLGDYHVKAGHFAGVDWTRARKLDQALDIMADRFLVDGATIAGQNPRFDLEHYQRDFAALGWTWPKLDYHVIDLCSPALFLVMAGHASSVSLRNVIPWAYGDPNRKQAHRAMGDVKDAIQVFFSMFDFFTMNQRPPTHDLGISWGRLA